MEPEYLTVQEVAALLRVAPRTVQRWADKGKLSCVRIGRTLRIPKKALEDQKVSVPEKTPSMMTPEERHAYAAKVVAELLAFHEEVRAKYGIVEDSVKELEEIRAERDKDFE